MEPTLQEEELPPLEALSLEDDKQPLPEKVSEVCEPGEKTGFDEEFEQRKAVMGDEPEALTAEPALTADDEIQVVGDTRPEELSLQQLQQRLLRRTQQLE
ncbi:unnamed protein product, partial [Effrenium voratum]